MIPSHDFEATGHVRVNHDPEMCPPDDVDPFTMPGSQSFTAALGIETTNPHADLRQQDEEEDPYLNFYELDENDVDGFGPVGMDTYSDL